jgi:tetratricopeptide (TPR) repeat protein
LNVPIRLANYNTNFYAGEDREWWRRAFAQLHIGCDWDSNLSRGAVAMVHHKESTYFSRKGLFTEALKEGTKAKELLLDPLLHEHLCILENHISLLEILAKYYEVEKALAEYPENVNPTSSLWKKRIMARLYLAESTNKFDLAVKSFGDIRITRETAKDSTPDLYLSINDYGMALMLKGEYKKAEVECRIALLSCTTYLGDGHEYTLASSHTLAEILKKVEKIDEALRYIQEAIRGRETLLGPDHPATVRSKIVKAELLLSKAVTLADYGKVGDLLSGCLVVLSAKLSDTHPVVLTCRSSLALVMLAQGKYDESENLNKAVLAARESGPWMEPAMHPDTLTSKHQLAEVLRVKDGCDAADKLSKSVYDERTRKLTNETKAGSDFHPDQLSSMHHRAMVLSLLGKHTEALELIDLAVRGRKAVLGPDHPDVHQSLTWNGEILRSSLSKSYLSSSQRTEKLNIIDALHKQALDGLTWIYGPEHQNTLQCKTHMAFARHERGVTSCYRDAKALHEQVFQANQRNLGELHPDTLKSKTRLARAIRVLDPSKHENAKMMWREACAGLANVLGVNAYCTVTAYKDYEDFFIKTYPNP